MGQFGILGARSLCSELQPGQKKFVARVNPGSPKPQPWDVCTSASSPRRKARSGHLCPFQGCGVDQRPPTSSQPPAPLQMPGLRSLLYLSPPSPSPRAFPTSLTALPLGPLRTRSPGAGCLFSWLGGAAGWVVESRGYNSLPAAAADPHTAGEGNGTGPSGGFNLSGISLALLNVSVQNQSFLQSQYFPASSLGAGGGIQRSNRSPKTIL